EAFAKRGKGEGCTTCHSQVVHGQPIKGYPVVIPRGHVEADSNPHYPDYPEGSRLREAALADCFRCHDNKTTYEGEVVSQKCDLCHLPDKISESLLF
ncbi:MAG: cytochrome c3 family protein, partial [Nitrospirales bacterium]